MKTIEFLAKVLAPEDNYVLFLARSTGATWNENYTSLEECAKAIEAHNRNQEVTVYMAIGAFADNIAPHHKTGKDYVQRRKHQATRFKTLAVDLDVGEHEGKYDSQKEAVHSLILACIALGIPKPMIVLSGNGVHAYWPFKESIKADTWEHISLALRAALESEGVKLDVSKVSDRSMVLRPVGAHHKKDPDNWKEVQVVMDAPERSTMEIAEPLAQFNGVINPSTVRKGFKKRQSAVMDALAEGDANIVLADMERCPQLDALLASAGVTDAAGQPVPEPLWRASLGIAKFCEDRSEAAIAFSSGHPDYNYEDTIEKMEGWSGTGPTVCATFESHCPSACETCPHKGSITSPAQLTGGTDTIEVEDPHTGEQEEVKIPTGYLFKNRNIWYKRPGQDEEEFVAPYPMWITARVTDADEATNSAKIAVEFPREGVKVITIDSALIAAGGNDLRKALADKQVYISSNIDPLKGYFMTYLRKLQDSTEAETSYTHFGWQKNDTFLIGDEVIGAKKMALPHLQGIARSYTDRLSRKGDLSDWVNAGQLFDLPGMEFQNFAATLGLASPIHQGAHFPSALVNLYSNDSGSGKTLTGKYGLSAWGDPEILAVQAKDTTNSFYKNFGVLKNMGAYIDEMTTMDVDRLREFVMCIQDGKEKGRLKQDASGFRDAASWRMPIITSSNKDMYEMLGKGIAAEAEELRILQLACPRVPYLEEHGDRIGYKLQILLERNHGLAGPLFIAEIIRRGGPEKVFEQMVAEFEKEFKFKFKGQERFYRGIVIDAYAGGVIYTALGLMKYDFRRGIRAVLREIEVLRQNRTNTARDGFDVLAQFLTERQADIVYFTTTPTNSYAMQPTPRSAIARVELTLDDREQVVSGMIYINRTGFQKWGARNGAEVRSTIEKMRQAGARITEHTRKTLYKGVVGASASGQTHCFAIDIMSNSRLIAACDDSKPDPDALIGQPRMRGVEA
jgi:hypothetical protein